MYSVSSCEQVSNNLLTICNKLHGNIKFVTRLWVVLTTLVQTLRTALSQNSNGLTSYSSQFLDYIFSKTNSVFLEECATVYQDMTQPLSRYWIASSHNT